MSSIQQAALVAIPLAAPPASDKPAAGSEEKGPTSPSGAGCLRAIVLVLVAVVTVAVPMCFYRQPMSQVWILSLNICSYVFVFLLCISRSRWFDEDFARLSYAPLLAFFSASAIGPATAVFVLFLGTAWAAGNLGYSLAVHRMREGTEPSIHALPVPSVPIEDDAIEDLNANLHTAAPFCVLLWALVMLLIVKVTNITDELLILIFISYFGWIHVWLFVILIAFGPMHGVFLGEGMEWFFAALVPWSIVSPLLCLVSVILAVLCHFLLMMFLVAYLWYNIAIYTHFLATATPSTKIRENEDTLHSEIMGDKTGQMKSDPRFGETPSEAAATLLLSS